MPHGTLGHQVRLLRQKQERLQQQVACLERSRRALQLRLAVAAKWCEVLDHVNQYLYSHSSHQGMYIPDCTRQLLQELTSASNWPSLESLLQPDDTTICPSTDQLALARRVISPPRQPKAEDMTPIGLAALMKEATESLAIKLQQLQALPPEQQESKRQEMAALCERVIGTRAAALFQGKHDVVEYALSVNLETMQPDPKAAEKQQTAQAAMLAANIDLREQQQEYLAATFRLYCDAVAAINTERQQLQVQMSQLETGAGSSAKASTPQALGPWQLQLQQQQSHADRLKVLLHKEFWLRALAVGFFFGSLTYEQLSKLMVLSWPYALRPVLVGIAVMQQQERRDEELLQQAQ